MRQLIISDPHGCFDELKKLISHISYNPDCDQLIFLGDYIDRGPASKDVVSHMMQLNQEYGAIVLKGNHEKGFLDWFDDNNGRYDVLFYKNGGAATLKSYVGETYGLSHNTIKSSIHNQHFNHIEFMRTLPEYYETNSHIFVHAGVDLNLPNWRDSSTFDFLCSREEFWTSKNTTGKTIIFGHTPTNYLHNLKHCHKPYVFNEGDRIAIDGGCAFGGQLNCLEIKNSGGIDYYFI